MTNRNNGIVKQYLTELKKRKDLPKPFIGVKFVEDDQIRDLELSCKHDKQCKVLDCRDRLKKMIQDELAVQ